MKIVDHAGALFYQGSMMDRIAVATMAVLLPLSLSAEEKPLPAYKPELRVKGQLNSVGTDALNNLMALWGEEFKGLHPDCTIQIEGKGTSAAMFALARGISDVGPMSRLPVPKELDLFSSARPNDVLLLIPVAMDAMCIVVRKDNPLEQVSLTQLDAMFSTTLKRGATKPITHWSQLGVGGDLADERIRLVGRNSAMISHGFFKKVVLLKGDFRDDVQEQRGSAMVVASLEPGYLGYVGFGYVTKNAKSLKVKNEDEYVAPTFASIRSGAYPISRELYIAVPAHKEKGIQPEVREFLRYVLSKEGQTIVEKDGYVPLGHEQCKKGIEMLGASQ